MNRLIIGAPFGNYLSWEGATSTVGTFTAKYRAGFVGRCWRVLRTVRRLPRIGAWVNRLGLPNPGIAKAKNARGKILSIHGFDEDDWRVLVAEAAALDPEAIEFNISCPNVCGSPGDHLKAGLAGCRLALCLGMRVIAKLPPLRWHDYAAPLYAAGVRAFHCCNTIPCAAGGMSGKPLKPYSLWAVEDLRKAYGNSVTLIGGGGVTDVADVKDYIAAGADHVAIASMLFNVFNWRKVPRLIECLGGV